MLILAFVSYNITHKEIHEKNELIFEPIKEMTAIFMGIFITLTPLLSLISSYAKDFNITSPGQYFWFSGIMSAFLDNAPTYLTFFTTAIWTMGYDINNKAAIIEFLNQHGLFVISISIASVFFGAVSYIGNAPNYMVKLVAESQGVKVSGFFGYIFKYSIPILVPIFLLIWFLFIK